MAIVHQAEKLRHGRSSLLLETLLLEHPKGGKAPEDG